MVGAPILINKSKVVFHGESLGAHVFSNSSHTVLTIEGVEDVDVHDIHFDTAGGNSPDDLDSDGVINVRDATRVSVHGCAIEVLEGMEPAGVVIFASDSVRIANNRIENVLTGVRTIDDVSFIDVVGNH